VSEPVAGVTQKGLYRSTCCHQKRSPHASPVPATDPPPAWEAGHHHRCAPMGTTAQPDALPCPTFTLIRGEGQRRCVTVLTAYTVVIAAVSCKLDVGRPAARSERSQNTHPATDIPEGRPEGPPLPHRHPRCYRHRWRRLACAQLLPLPTWEERSGFM
jgi:hypothetical protein